MNTSYRFPSYPTVPSALARLRRTKPDVFTRAGERMALRLFRFASTNVPAYRALLKRHGISPASVRSADAFASLPATSKDDYLRAFAYRDLFPGRTIGAGTIASTSGSSGQPFYIPRSDAQDRQYEYIADLILHNQFALGRHRTLGVIGFGLGIWIGGIFTYKVMERIAARTGQLTLAPVGSNVELYLDAVRHMAPHFDQVLLMGYAPFVRDVLDRGAAAGIRWQDHRIRILTAAEGFSEKFRDILANGASLREPLRDTANIYGTVELGTMAHETPLTNLIRRIAVERPAVMRAILPHPSRQPTLAQYHPDLTYFEEHDGELYGTGYGSAIPLIRYRFRDVGGVIGYDEMVARLADAGVDIAAEARRANIDRTVIRLPFVFVYERNDNTVTIRGANIYADEVRRALERHAGHTTGRFAMAKRETASARPRLDVFVELRDGVSGSPALRERISATVTQTLLTENSEFRDQHGIAPEQIAPRIRLCGHQDPRYFDRKGKQRWRIPSDNG
jgi:phenylacetate-CoA ligase